MSKCPNGHELPHKAGKQRCTPLFCIDEAGIEVQGKAPPVRRDNRIKKDEREEKERALKMEVRRKVRASMVEQPPVLEQDRIETYSQGRLVKLLPKAVAEVEYQLTYGDDRQRMEAARDVLDANGMRKRDAVGAGGQTIILNIQGSLPWKQTVVNGQVVTNGGSEKEQSGEVAGSNQAALPNGGDDKH